jgi:hypothetical protein
MRGERFCAGLLVLLALWMLWCILSGCWVFAG